MRSRTTDRFQRAFSRLPETATKGYRALGLLEGNDITWFWIGSHADYDELISRLYRTQLDR